MTSNRPLLSDVLPSFSEELQQLLASQGEPQLAAQVSDLKIFDRCRCGEDFCATFYVRPKQKVPYNPGFRSVPLKPKTGLVTVDVADGKIVCVEALYRDEIRRELIQLLPDGESVV